MSDQNQPPKDFIASIEETNKQLLEKDKVNYILLTLFKQPTQTEEEEEYDWNDYDDEDEDQIQIQKQSKVTIKKEK